MSTGPVIALIDGEHHPGAVRAALDRLDAERGVAAVLFCGGEEKVRPEALERPEDHYGRPVAAGAPPFAALRRLALDTRAEAVVDLADDPVLPAPAKLRLAALALHLGLPYECPGLELAVPTYERVDFVGPKLAVIATGKRMGKTAVAGYWARLLRGGGRRAVVVSMGRGGPADPQVADPGVSLEDLLSLAREGRHAASDYLEVATLEGVTAVGCRRVGGGLAGAPWESNVMAAGALAASLGPDALVFEGSGACLPPVAVDRTVCLVGDRRGALGELGPYRLLRAQLILLLADRDAPRPDEIADLTDAPTLRCELVPEPVHEVPEGARVAVFSTGKALPAGLEPVVRSSNLSRRSALVADLDRAAKEGCDVYLTELKGAAIDLVADRAAREGAAVVWLRNRPVGVDGDLDAALIGLYEDASADA